MIVKYAFEPFPRAQEVGTPALLTISFGKPTGNYKQSISYLSYLSIEELFYSISRPI